MALNIVQIWIHPDFNVHHFTFIDVNNVHPICRLHFCKPYKHTVRTLHNNVLSYRKQRIGYCAKSSFDGFHDLEKGKSAPFSLREGRNKSLTSFRLPDLYNTRLNGKLESQGHLIMWMVSCDPGNQTVSYILTCIFVSEMWWDFQHFTCNLGYIATGLVAVPVKFLSYNGIRWQVTEMWTYFKYPAAPFYSKFCTAFICGLFSTIPVHGHKLKL